jgi:hypothetical protein
VSLSAWITGRPMPSDIVSPLRIEGEMPQP